ncbi:MAG: hypothetical protein AAFP19_10765 [Bacteroidota bacterium]
MRSILLLCLLLGMGHWGQAQDDYTYISDRSFKDPSDLIGYNFKPVSMEIPDEVEEEISPGEYSFGITRNNLYVAGDDIKGVYSINNINPTEYGYKLLLMNARNPMLQGHLKVILNNKAQVEAMVFKRSNKEREIIFHQAQIAKNLYEREKAYFTNRWNVTFEAPDSLWGKTIYPFFRIHNDLRDEQERLQADDSTSITFIETIEIIEKVKKKRKKRKKKEEEENIEVGDFGEVPAAGIDQEEAEEVIEEEKEEVGAEMADEVISEEMSETPDSTNEEVKKKIKIIKKYFVEVRSIVTYEEGDTEDKVWKYQVKKIVEREDDQAGPNEERFQWEIETQKGNPIYLYRAFGR